MSNFKRPMQLLPFFTLFILGIERVPLQRHSVQRMVREQENMEESDQKDEMHLKVYSTVLPNKMYSFD